MLNACNYSFFIHQLPTHSQTFLLLVHVCVPLSTYLTMVELGGGAGAICFLLQSISLPQEPLRRWVTRDFKAYFSSALRGHSHFYREGEGPNDSQCKVTAFSGENRAVLLRNPKGGNLKLKKKKSNKVMLIS